MSDEASQNISLDFVLDLLACGEMNVRGLMPGSSNYTFLAEISNDRYRGLAVYKPSQGETPLWDFPHGTLCNRELAAYLVSEALDWHLVPPTVLRVGSYGKGAVQFFVDADFSQHYFTFQDDSRYRLPLQQTAVFDLIVNNADRKGGHCLVDGSGRMWIIDHGVCFHVQNKLRTVIWDFAGQAIPGDVLEAMAGLRDQLDPGCQLQETLESFLTRGEILAMTRRLERLLASGLYPALDPHRRSYPWPLV